MKRPGFFEGAVFAVLAALIGGGLHFVLTTLLPSWMAWKLAVSAVALAYLSYLLARGDSRIGRITTLAAWAMATLAAWWLAPTFSLYVLIQLLVIWLARSLYFHSGVLAALADAALCGLALAAGTVAMLRTGSLAMGFWCFFLVQALFVAIPAGWPGRHASTADDRFEQAHRNAEALVRRHFSSL